MTGPGGFAAWVTSEPWSDRYEVRLARRGLGVRDAHAVRVDDGLVVYEEHGQGAVVGPLLRLSYAEVQALAEALRDERRPDVSADALADARTVRDRLLTIVERGSAT